MITMTMNHIVAGKISQISLLPLLFRQLIGTELANFAMKISDVRRSYNRQGSDIRQSSLGQRDRERSLAQIHDVGLENNI